MAADISAVDLINQFKYALANKWGYIWGKAGIKWTQQAQDNLVQYMVNKYGTNWKNSAEAKKDDRYQSALNGSKWIGHYVADCSGLFSWAFKELGGYMYHGSNTMYDKYCTSKGKLSGGKRTDGRDLQPGTAVFVEKSDGKKSHVGLYIGDGKVIEAASTAKGVITSSVTDTKWKCWGELKGVSYGESPEPEPVPKGYAEVTGKRVALRKAPTTAAAIIMRIDTGERVKIEDPPPSDWEYVSYAGKTGYMMKEFLKEG